MGRAAKITGVFVVYWLHSMVFTGFWFGLAADVAWDGSREEVVTGLARFIGRGLQVASPHYDTEYGLFLFLATFGIPGILTWLTVKRLKRITTRGADAEL